MNRALWMTLMFLPTLVHARGGDLRDAADAVEEAMDLTRDEGGRCRRALARDLEDLRDDIDDLRDDFSSRRARRAIDLVAELRDAADDDCDRAVSRRLREVRDLLEDAMDDSPRRRRVSCWHKDDPGCGHTKNGGHPMEKAAFSALLKAVRKQKPHVFPMQDTVKALMKDQYLTSRQLAILIAEFKPHVFPMQDVVKICAPKLVDPQNGGVVTAEFHPHVFPAQDAARIIGKQRAD